MSKTTWQETFRDSPRYAAIESVFKLIKTDALVTEVYSKMGRVMVDLNFIESDALPALVKAELKNSPSRRANVF